MIVKLAHVPWFNRRFRYTAMHLVYCRNMYTMYYLAIIVHASQQTLVAATWYQIVKHAARKFSYRHMNSLWAIGQVHSQFHAQSFHHGRLARHHVLEATTALLTPVVFILNPPGPFNGRRGSLAEPSYTYGSPGEERRSKESSYCVVHIVLSLRGPAFQCFNHTLLTLMSCAQQVS